jgi:chromate reductase
VTEGFDVALIVGSLRAASWNRQVAELLVAESPAHLRYRMGGLGYIPPYDDDLWRAGEPEPVASLRALLGSVHGVVVDTPSYNHGIAGVVKNALDWVSRPAFQGPLLGKASAAMSVTTSRLEPAVPARQLRDTLAICGAVVMDEPDLLVRSVAHKVREHGGEWPEEIRLRVREFGARFAEHVGAVVAAHEATEPEDGGERGGDS